MENIFVLRIMMENFDFMDVLVSFNIIDLCRIIMNQTSV
jgi:hypothetical protein